jgi:hypothetical protein
MVNTLRRKMFKLGGSANTHGVGITSGLKMKKGGTVHVGVGSGNQPMKMGPDGKMREGHFLPFLAGAGSVAGRLVGLPAMRALIAAARQGTTKPLTSFVRGQTGPIKGKFGTVRDFGPGITGASTSPLAQAGRAIQLATPIGGTAGGIAGLTMAGLDRAGITTPGADDTLLETLARGTGKIAIDTSVPGLLTRGVGMLTGDEKTGTFAQTSLYDKLSGRKDTAAPVPDSEDESERTKEIRTQQSQFEGLSEKAEALAKEISRENNLKTLSQAALTFGQAASAGEDFATSLSLGTAPIFDELGRRRDLQENIAGQLATQIIADEATQSAMIAEAAKTGDPAAVNRMQKYFDAYNEGVTNILPIDAKGKMDTANMAPGTVYMDLEGASGSRYVAVDTKKPDGSGGVPKAFDSIEDANAYAQT